MAICVPCWMLPQVKGLNARVRTMVSRPGTTRSPVQELCRHGLVDALSWEGRSNALMLLLEMVPQMMPQLTAALSASRRSSCQNRCLPLFLFTVWWHSAQRDLARLAVARSLRGCMEPNAGECAHRRGLRAPRLLQIAEDCVSNTATGRQR